ncbi:MAG: amidohydrolase family protein [Planctomycetota bacterium]|nr:amidohydrolase family protein [Planctomycetota bacterium]MDA1105418.1 amidohydrolase family protein [Planctomycetota bacterium]
MSARRQLTQLTHLALAAMIAASGTFSQAANAQNPTAAPSQSKAMAITHVTVHPMTAGEPTITDGFILFNDGKIVAVGPMANMPNAESVDILEATGLHVYPGLVAIGSPMGLIEVDQVRSTDDRRELGRWHPETIAAVAVNPDSELIPVSRANGILTSISFPDGGVICGHASALRMDGWTTEDLTIEPRAGLVIKWPATEPLMRRGFRNRGAQADRSAETVKQIDQFFDEAKAWAAARAANPTTAIDLRYDRVQAVLGGTEPVFIDASSAGQIESAVLWASKRGFKAVIIGGSGAEEVAELLTRHDVPVVIRGTLSLPRLPDDPYDSPFSLPARLRDAGVRYCIAPADESLGGDASNDRWLPHNAGVAVAYGLTPDQAMAAITRDAAAIMGLGDTLGTLEAGKSATIILTDGSPLDIRSRVGAAWIDGRKIELTNNQDLLEERYREKYRQLEQR